MLIKRTKGWELPESRATPEGLYLGRREVVKAMGLGAVSLAAPAWRSAQDDPSAGKYPAPRNDKYGMPAPITAEKLATTYNNFYEFGTDKGIWQRRAEAARSVPGRSRSTAWSRSRSSRLRRSSRQDAARGARLSPPLRRDLVDDRAVVRLPAEGAGRVRASPPAAPSLSS